MKEKLLVFVSSKQKEFQTLRRQLSEAIGLHPFLEPILMEFYGANPENSVDASLNLVRKSRLYVGIFGKMYSETVVKEYREAVRQKLTCLIYLKKVKHRDPNLDEFLINEVTSYFNFQDFSTNKSLITVIPGDIHRFLFDRLQDGLKLYDEQKQNAKKIDEESNKEISIFISGGWHKGKTNMLKLLNSISTHNHNYAVGGMASFIDGMARYAAEKIGYKGKDLEKPLGWILAKLLDAKIINKTDLKKINHIQHVRNNLVHNGQQISEKEIGNLILTVPKIINKLMGN